MTEAKALCERCGAPLEERVQAREEGGGSLACSACGAEIAGAAPTATSTPTPTSTLAPTSPSTPTRASTPTPSAPTPTPASTPTATPAPGPGDDEDWAAVLAHWDDEEAHRAFLARFADLDGLAGAGRRYREALAQRPGDPVALRWRDEIVKRAMAQGLMRSPRPSPPRVSPKLLRWAALAGMIGATVLVAGWMAWRLLRLARS